jgi:hypothetical protein
MRSSVVSTAVSGWGAGDQIAFTAERCDYYYGCYGPGVNVLSPDGSIQVLAPTVSSEPAWRP